ncbi:MAG: acyl-CoA dehydrogenase family protein [Microthrixaceae bacterium]
MPTHDVTNQPPPLSGYNLFDADVALSEALVREGAASALPDLARLGQQAGTAEAQEWGRAANEHPPQLLTHDRYGHRIDEVRFHPAYHSLMSVAIEEGLGAVPWGTTEPGAHVARCAKVLVWYQVDGGHICPVSMTYSVVPALRQAPELAASWEPGLTAGVYDPGFVPPEGKQGLTCGMAMTEKQGGSDVRANTTVARHLAEDEYLITGHKWFCSAPMSDGFLTLAQASEGLTCFLLPRWRPDGTRNNLSIQRLKDKLGDRSNASSEVEFDEAWVRRVGDEGRGVRTIIEMVNHTRLDCTLGATAIMRQGTAQAVWHSRHRSAFGATLVGQPLMQAVLADLALESEAATTSAMWLAGLFDASSRGDAHAALLARLATPVLKYWICKRAPAHSAEALECLGGVGYVEETGLPRLFRQSPLNGVWEGSGNVICLDVLRAMARSPEATEALLGEIRSAGDGVPEIAAATDELRALLADPDHLERRARLIVERLALLTQAALLVRHAPGPVAEAFVASRLGGEWGRAFGTLSPAAPAAAIVDRALAI